MAYLFDFNYSNPTQIVFGTHSFARLGELIPPEARVLLLYGGGSIKRNGVYEQVTQALAGRQIVEFAGVEPNTTLETLEQAVALVREDIKEVKALLQRLVAMPPLRQQPPPLRAKQRP